jgi:tRNA A-37 threonylcarbamoyl transferase component Bud32
MVKSGSLELVLIDFGLSVSTTQVEDKAVDLYVLEKSFLNPGTVFFLITDSESSFYIV